MLFKNLKFHCALKGRQARRANVSRHVLFIIFIAALSRQCNFTTLKRSRRGSFIIFIDARLAASQFVYNISDLSASYMFI